MITARRETSGNRYQQAWPELVVMIGSTETVDLETQQAATQAVLRAAVRAGWSRDRIMDTLEALGICPQE